MTEEMVKREPESVALSHSAKGSVWATHKYVDKYVDLNGKVRYVYDLNLRKSPFSFKGLNLGYSRSANFADKIARSLTGKEDNPVSNFITSAGIRMWLVNELMDDQWHNELRPKVDAKRFVKYFEKAWISSNVKSFSGRVTDSDRAWKRAERARQRAERAERRERKRLKSWGF